MTADRVYDDASQVSAEDGAVVIDGPDGVDVLLTPEAAIDTSQRLLESGMEAAGQRAEKAIQAATVREPPRQADD